MAKVAPPRTRARSSPDVAYITPALLTWALDRSALSRDAIAKKLKVDPSVIQSWESEDEEVYPQFDKAWDLAQVLAIPFGYLFLSKAPDTSLPIPDFRKRQVGRTTAEFRQLLSDVLLKRDWYRDYVRNAGEPKAAFVGRFGTQDTESEVAADIRDALGMTPQVRRAVYSWADYLSMLARRAEQKGILVMRTSVVGNNTHRPVSASEVQGFALADEWAPLVFVNSSDFKAAQIFTLAHELAHIWIASTGISNPEEGESGTNAVERFCNSVATEVLVPEDEFTGAWRTRADSSSVNALAREFWVSSLVILRRARELRHLSERQYNELRNEALAAQIKPKGGGGGSYFRTAAVRLGSRLPVAVFGEVERGRLPLSRASALLDMRVPTLLKFAESLK